MWCHAAHQLETHLDYLGDSGPAWDRLCHDLAGTPELCAIAERYLTLDRSAIQPHEWAPVADAARDIDRQLLRARRGPDRPVIDRGTDLGLDL